MHELAVKLNETLKGTCAYDLLLGLGALDDDSLGDIHPKSVVGQKFVGAGAFEGFV